MRETDRFSPLFTPFQLGDLTLRNRIVLPPMGLAVCQAGTPGPATAEYFARRAAGGAAMLMTEGVYIDHPSSGDNPDNGRFYGDEQATVWREVAARVHTEGSYILPELWHVGLHYDSVAVLRNRSTTYRPELCQIGPSGFIAPGTRVTSEMTQNQIDDVMASFGAGARLARDLGFDGVELHGAHGFLIDQFLWRPLNHRTDQYGGDARSRGRFAAEIVAECKRQLAPGQPVILRISNFKIIDYQARLAETPDELEQLLAPIVEAGIDMFDCSQRRFWEPAFEGSELNLAGWVKKVTGKPTMTVGSVGLDADQALRAGDQRFVRDSETDLRTLDWLMERFMREEFDLIGVGRAMIAEPNWARYVQTGELRKLRRFSTTAMRETVRLQRLCDSA